MEEVWARSSSRKKMAVDNEEAMAGLAAFPISEFSYRLGFLLGQKMEYNLVN